MILKDSALYDAISEGDLEKMRAVLEANPDLAGAERGSLGIPYLCWAVSHGRIEAVKLLLDAGADINAAYTLSMAGAKITFRPLAGAAASGHLELVKFLVDKGAKVNPDATGAAAPLTGAASNGHLEVVQYLVAKGASLEAPSRDGNPLFAAIKGGHIEIVRYLLEKGIDPHVAYPDLIGKLKNALYFANEEGQSAIAEILAKNGCALPQGVDKPEAKPSNDKKAAKRQGPVDFLKLREMIRDATRQTFIAVREACVFDKLYAFALFSDDDAVTVVPAANTEGWFRHCVAKARATEPESVNYYRWAFPEWGSYCQLPAVAGAAEAFEAISDSLRCDVEHGDEAEFVRYKGRVFASMVLGLQDLFNEGFFGVGKDRDQLTLLCSVSDSCCSTWLEEASARQLNSTQSYKVFLKEWKTYQEEDFNLHQEDPADVYREFADFLDRRKKQSDGS
jgi:ankyrin repeat protein